MALAGASALATISGRLEVAVHGAQAFIESALEWACRISSDQEQYATVNRYP